MNQTSTYDDQNEDLEQQESEGDLGKISFKDTVVINTDWTIETLFTQIKKGNIDLDPDFQRRSAWDDVRQSKLIESVITGLPIPSIVLAESKVPGKSFIVLDGKQRLMSITRFLDGELSLRGLEFRPDLNGTDIDSIPSDDRQYIENSTIRTTVIRNWKDENFLYLTFYRLNSGSLPLSPQELRRALIGGRLLSAIDIYLEQSQSIRKLIGEKRDRRMRDSELVLRFVAFENYYPNYSGNLKELLDRTTLFFEKNWAAQSNAFVAISTNLNRAIDTEIEIFGKDSFRKWRCDTNVYERALNRAVFDCKARYFSSDKVGEIAKSKKDDVLNLFKQVCDYPEFKASIERTTKSKVATETRMRVWGESLANLLGLQFDSQDYRII